MFARRFGLVMSSAIAALVVGMTPSAMAIPAGHIDQRSGKQRKAKQSAVAYTAPRLNRAHRHPFAQSYREAADISFGLGVRTRPLR